MMTTISGAMTAAGAAPGGMADFWRGAFLCGSLVMTIGAQVSYVLRQGILRSHVGKVVAICIASDIVFILAGIAGAGILVQQYGWLVHLLVYLGAAYLTWFGLLALRRAWRGGRAMTVGAMTVGAMTAGTMTAGAMTVGAMTVGAVASGAAEQGTMTGFRSGMPLEPAGKVVLTIAALTWLNPHVYVDAILILGGAGAKLAPDARTYFIAGAMLADIICFAALGYGARLLAPLFAKPTAWRVLDLLVGVIVLAIAATQLR